VRSGFPTLRCATRASSIPPATHHSAQRATRNVAWGKHGVFTVAGGRAAGRTKSTIHRAIKTGRLSASRTQDGGYSIDPAELARVYPSLRSNGQSNGQRDDTQRLGDRGATGVERREIALLREQLADRDETIRDLRARLDSEVDERRRLLSLLTAPERRPWWRRWFR